jgi:hypothetical protein
MLLRSPYDVPDMDVPGIYTLYGCTPLAYLEGGPGGP